MKREKNLSIKFVMLFGVEIYSKKFKRKIYLSRNSPFTVFESP